jgi:hypothetical protein
MAECLEHLNADITSNNVDTLISEMLERGVKLRAVKRWIHGEYYPIGQNLIYLRFGLDMLGYSVDEISILSETAYNLGKLMYINKLSVIYLGEKLHMPDRAVTTCLLGKQVIGSDKIDIIEIFCQNFSNTDANISDGVVENDVVCTDEFLTKENIVQTFCHMMKALNPLAEAILSDRFTAGERREMRDMLGRNDLFRTSLVLDGLSSEDSRKHVLKKR